MNKINNTLCLTLVFVLIISMCSCCRTTVIDHGNGFLEDPETGVCIFAFEETCDLVKYPYNDRHIVLPTGFDGKTITGTFEQLFNGYKKDLESVIIPDTYTELSYCTFYNHTELKSIYIPLSVTIIEECAISMCSDLTIFCEAPEKPAGWHKQWYNGCENVNVVWGCKKEYFPNH